jgi:dissimilatory sulfite reductase related protein
MATRNYAGTEVEVTPDGHLKDASVWSDVIASGIAGEEGIILTAEHFQVLLWLRKCHAEGDRISIRSINKSGVVELRRFYTLFPGAALRKSSRIAGIPKPENCI